MVVYKPYLILIKKFTLSIITLFWLLLSGACNSIKIIDKPVVMNSERDSLTLEYLENRYGLIQDTPNIHPKMVVVHWTAIPTLEKTLKAFDSVKLPNWRPEIVNASALNVAAQFVVDQDGKIYRLLPETYMARHVIGLNYCSIGIENVGGLEEKPLTKKQLKSNIKLIKYLKNKYPEIDYVIGHLEYTNFEKHKLWREKDASYRTEKTDPGEDFINSIRKATSKFNWKPVPKK